MWARAERKPARRMSNPPVNTDRLIESFGADIEFLNRIYTAYMVDSRERIELLKDHLAAEQIEACGHVAHALKGASLNVGADALAKPAGELEAQARSGELTNGQALIDAIVSEFDSVHSFLIDYLESIKS